MRLKFLFVLMLLHPSSQAAGAAESVLVEPAITRLVHNAAQLRAACQVDGNYDACTNFIAFRLEAACSFDGAAWHIDARVSFRPWIILQNIRQLPHEQDHIRDVSGFAAEHIAHLRLVPHESEAFCRQTALQQSREFGTTMRDFARRSSASRHPGLFAKVR